MNRFRTIRAVEARSGYRLAIYWNQGPHTIVDLAEDVKRGGVFSSLKDVSLFAQVKIGERNRVIEWPNPSDKLGYPLIDMDAESLYELGTRQKSEAVVSKIVSAIKSMERIPQKG